MRCRRPIHALLSAAIGVYLLVAPPPAKITHSVMEESDGGQNDVLHQADGEGEEHHRYSRDEAFQSSMQQELQPNEDENDEESASRPTSELLTPIVESSISAISEEGETSAGDVPKKKNKRPKAVKENKKRMKKKSVGPLFHMVFTTGSSTLSTLNARSIESVFYANPKGRLHIHQPKLLVAANNDNRNSASNTSSGNPSATLLDETHPRLAPLIEHGYNITFHRYDPADMLMKAVKASIGRHVEVNETAAKEFIAHLPQYRRQEFWYSNESNLLRLALLYVQGGTYMDTDVIILRSYDEAFAGGGGGSGAVKEKRNASAIEPLPKDGAIAVPENNVIPFPKPHHPFVAAALNNFMRHFNGTVWGNNGPRVLKRTAWERPDLLCEGDIKDIVFAKWAKQLKEHPMADMESKPGSDARVKKDRNTNAKEDGGRCVTLLDKKTIQPIGYRKWFEYCVAKKSPTGGKAEVLLERAYASHLNNRLTGGLFDDQHEGSDRQSYVEGSACDLLMNNYCTVCS